MTPALEVQGLWKRFPGVTALRDVSLAIAPGEVHAVVGENGAGKSTLVKILAGAQAPDAGSVIVGGHAHRAFTPRHARDAGIAVIHQERQIAADLSVTENVLLGRLPSSGGRIRWHAARDAAATMLASLDAEIDLDARVRDLPAAQRQLLEIARALYVRAQVVLMDEPTSSLGAHDAAQLFRSVRRLRDAGVAVIYVSHHLEEVLDLADRISVLRDGRLVTTTVPAEVDTRRLAELMIGRPLPVRSEATASRAGTTAEPALVLDRVSAPPALGEVSLTVAAGEIVCITGLVGSGRRELARIATGIEAPATGTVTAAGVRPTSVRDAVRAGVVYLSDDRKAEAILPGQTTFDNVALGMLVTGAGWRSVRAATRERIREAIGRVGVDLRRSDDRIELLSGGNQQKALLARWIAVGARMYVLDEPTVGVDVGARAEIYELLRREAASGAGVLICSSDYEEIREVADRALVLRGGRIAGELSGAEITVDGLIALQHHFQ